MTELAPTREDTFSVGLRGVGWQGVEVCGGVVRPPTPPAEAARRLANRDPVPSNGLGLPMGEAVLSVASVAGRDRWRARNGIRPPSRGPAAARRVRAAPRERLGACSSARAGLSRTAEGSRA